MIKKKTTKKKQKRNGKCLGINFYNHSVSVSGNKLLLKNVSMNMENSMAVNSGHTKCGVENQ